VISFVSENRSPLNPSILKRSAEDYYRGSGRKISETITKVFTPMMNLRPVRVQLTQQYFFVSCSLRI
jgi:hypothetical protein